MQRYGMSIGTFRELEIPVFFTLKDRIIEEREEQERNSKTGGRK